VTPPDINYEVVNLDFSMGTMNAISTKECSK